MAGVQRPDGKIVAVQQLRLTNEGEKADVLYPRLTTGALGAGAVRFGPAAEVIGLAEGVETALSAMELSGVTVWASLGSARLHQVELPPEVKEVHVFVDNDEPGRLAAKRAADVHASLGRRVYLRSPPDECGNWNDFINLIAIAMVVTRFLRNPRRTQHEYQGSSSWRKGRRGSSKAPHHRIKFRRTSTNDIMAATYDPIKWVVPGYISEGFLVLAGRQKLGKTWLAIDMALAVATGGAAIGSIMCEQGDVLYIDMENGPRRIQGRIATLFPDERNRPDLSRLEWVTEAPQMDAGFIDELEHWRTSVPRPLVALHHRRIAADQTRGEHDPQRV